MRGWRTTAIPDLDAVRDISRCDDGEWVFRGQACKSWRLASSLARLGNLGIDQRDLQMMETQSIDTFRQRATGVVHEGDAERQLIACDNNTVTLLMRHFGATTRALDWSRSLWVAAYFASISQPLCDGAIWAVNYSAYGIAATQCAEHRFFEDEEGSFIGNRLFDPVAPEHIIFVALQPAFHFARVRAQRGLFSVPSRPTADHGTYLGRYMPTGSLRRWIVPAQMKRSVVGECARLGIAYHNLYPDLSGAAIEADEAFASCRVASCRACAA